MFRAKKLFISAMLILFTSSFALAATWYERFVFNYQDEGIDKAVQVALVDDEQKPYFIIKKALLIRNLQKEILIKALFCAGANPDEVQTAAVQNGLDEQIVYEGYQLAITECRRLLVEGYNFIPSVESPPGRLASPWNFKK